MTIPARQRPRLVRAAAVVFRPAVLFAALFAGVGVGPVRAAVQDGATRTSATADPTARATRADFCPIPPVIDGVLEEDVWGPPPSGDMLAQVVPVAGAPPSQRTVFRLLRDDDHVYVGVWCFDEEPGAIRATQVARDAVLDPDARVEILLDTFGDKQNAFWFQIGPAGGKGDALVSRAGGGFRKDWDGLFRASSSIDARGWYAEFALPAATLSFDPASDTWRFNLRRFVRRASEEARWSGADPRLGFFNPTHAGELNGVAGLSQGLGVDVRPFATAGFESRSEPGDREDGEFDADAGVDVSWALSPATRLSLSLNTDFAESEVDDRQVNLSRFSLFFPEKRDFFLEDDGLFAFGSSRDNSVRPFFSRRIGLFDGDEVPIVAAAKLTSRTQRYSLGVLSVVTDATDRLDDESLTVARGSLFFGQQSEFGFLGTLGAPDGTRDASTYGADLALRTDRFMGDRSLNFSAYLVGSNEIGARGEAWFAELDYPNDEVFARLRHFSVDADFDPALGFVRRPGTRRTQLFGGYAPRLYSHIRSLEFSADLEHVANTAGRTESQSVSLVPLGVTWESGEEVQLSVIGQREVLFEPFEIADGVTIAPGDRDWWSTRLDASTSERRPVSASVGLSAGDFYDGTRRGASFGAAWRIGSRANVDIEYEYSDIELVAGDFDVHVARLGGEYNVSRDLTLTALAQYDDVTDDAALNARLRWILDPGNEVFLVLDQSWEVLAGSVAPRRTNVTAKIGWTLRF